MEDEASSLQTRISAARTRMASDAPRTHSRLPALSEVEAVDVTERYTFSQILADEQAGERFIEKIRFPAVIRGLVSDWPLSSQWSELVEQIGDSQFEVKSMQSGQTTDLSFRDFILYMQNSASDNQDPIYLFHPIHSTPAITDAYKVPAPFQHNLFSSSWSTVDHQWLIVGGTGSGSKMHRDFYHTSAWNSLIKGNKRWCFFDPSTPKETLQLNAADGYSGSEPLRWFSERLPELLADKDGPQPIQVLQRPGETVWVPAGWYHIVLNMDETVAVTENFTAPCDAPLVWTCLRDRVLDETDRAAGELMDEIMPTLMESYPEHVDALRAAIDASEQELGLEFVSGMAVGIHKIEDVCDVCFDAGELLSCGGCDQHFHLNCLDPPMSSMPDPADWCCSQCSLK